jgi:glutathione-independent formaldehyde dehydrogenase
MKALVYNGPRNVSVSDVPDPRIGRPTDAIVQITRTNICGSDLHMYEGRTDMETGRVLGHENLGRVAEVGPAVQKIKVGDMVAVPFNVACGHCENCENCEKGLPNYCLIANPDPQIAGAAYGFADMGPWEGGQAQYLMVPWADFNLLQLPDDAEEKQNDYVMLSDIFPTGYHGTELAGVRPGDTVVIFGAGPVGLMAAHSAALRGAAQVFVVDKAADRLALAERYGATAVNFADADPVEVITDATDGAGVDCGIEAVGYQAHDASGHEHPEMVLDKLIEVVRATGRIGVVGVYNPQDPGAATEDAQQGRYGFNYGLVFDKAITMGQGQCPVKRYNYQLRDLIIRGKARPSLIVSHELPLDQAPDAYKNFDQRADGWTKVLLKPGRQAA